MVRTTLAFGLLTSCAAFGPTEAELRDACEGVAPGRPKDECTLKRMQDTNAHATFCFQHDSAEGAFKECTMDFCSKQGEVCSGPGGAALCKQQCLEYGFSQYENLQAFVRLPGAKWKAETTTAAPVTTTLPLHSVQLKAQPHSGAHLQPQSKSEARKQYRMKLHAESHSGSHVQPQGELMPKSKQDKLKLRTVPKPLPEKHSDKSSEKVRETNASAAVSMHHAKTFHIPTAPTAQELSAACEGVGAGRPNDRCSTTMMRDANAKATGCFYQHQGDETGYRQCCHSFCSTSGETCTGPRGQYVCSHQCTEYAYSQFINLKALTTLPGAIHKTTALVHHPRVSRQTGSEAEHIALIEHESALSGRRFFDMPSFEELKLACSGVAPGRPKDACTTARLRFTNGKARECFESSAQNKTEYQVCCTDFCHTESDACTGDGGKALCFAQCVENSHPLFTNLKALAGVPGAIH